MIKSSEFGVNNTDPEIGKHINTDPEKAKHVEICLMFIVYVYCLWYYVYLKYIFHNIKTLKIIIFPCILHFKK